MIWGPATQASSSRGSRVDSVLARILLLEVHNLGHAFGSTFGDGRKKRRRMEATETDERGAQLSQECPHPSTYQAEQRSARHNSLVRPLVSNGLNLGR